MRRIAVFAVVVAGTAAEAQPVPARAVDAIFADMAAPDAPGCAIGVARDGRTLVSRAYGSADLEHRVPLRPTSTLEAGSVSKQFTAAAVLLLVQDGKLALEDDVRTHVPELPDYGETITIAHLLDHTSGLRDWGSVAAIGGWPRGTRVHTQADAIEIIRRQRSLNYRPGAEYSYTNSGYNLLTEIVKRVSGRTLAEFTRERLFVPLGMTSTSWRDDFRRIVPGRAIAYARDGERFEQEMPFEDVYGNGGLLTTVGDLLTWNQALSTGRLGREVTARLQKTSVLNQGIAITYAGGLFIQPYRGTAEIAHGGATAGYRAWLGRFPAHRLSIALLCNRGDAQAARLGHEVADLFLPIAREPAAALDYNGPDRSGRYVNELTGMTTRLVLEQGRLKIADGPVLVPQGPDRMKEEESDIVFLSPDLFRRTSGQGQAHHYRKVVPWAPAAADLAGFAGVFASEEADAAYVVRPDADGLVLQLDSRPHETVELKPSYRDAFEGDGMLVRFERDPEGEVQAMRLGVARVRDMRFTRIPAPSNGGRKQR